MADTDVTFRFATKDDALVDDILNDIGHFRRRGLSFTHKLYPAHTPSNRGFTKHIYLHTRSGDAASYIVATWREKPGLEIRDRTMGSY